MHEETIPGKFYRIASDLSCLKPILFLIIPNLRDFANTLRDHQNHGQRLGRARIDVYRVLVHLTRVDGILADIILTSPCHHLNTMWCFLLDNTHVGSTLYAGLGIQPREGTGYKRCKRHNCPDNCVSSGCSPLCRLQVQNTAHDSTLGWMGRCGAGHQLRSYEVVNEADGILADL